NSSQNYPIIHQQAPMPGQDLNGQPVSGQGLNWQPMSPHYANPLHFAYPNVPSSTTSPVQVKQEEQSPSTYGQSPYPPQFVPERSASISTPQSSVYQANLHAMNLTGVTSLEESRRMSLPAQPFQNALLTTPINEATSQQQLADQT